jgi:hypothetical protein
MQEDDKNHSTNSARIAKLMYIVRYAMENNLNVVIICQEANADSPPCFW